jgi:hypothetical protein
VVAILADISSRKAAELIATISPPRLWLAGLPGAADSISRKSASLKWTPAGNLERGTYTYRELFGGNPRRASGCYERKYDNGRIIWAGKYGAQAISGAIEAAHRNKEKFQVGYPVGDEKAAPKSPFDTHGTRQSFASTVVYSSRHGVCFVYPETHTCYEKEGGSGGWLGFPTGEAMLAYHSVICQRFEGGAIYHRYGDSSEGAFSVHLEAVQELRSGYPNFRPISAASATISATGMQGSVQRFLVNLEDGGQEVAVYSSADHGVAVVVAPEIWGYYRDLGGPESALGFPIESKRPLRNGDWSQPFEGGKVYCRRGNAPITIPGETRQFLGVQGRKLGLPLSEERPIGAGPDRIQFFDHGAVVLRDGKREILVRPEPVEPAEMANPQWNPLDRLPREPDLSARGGSSAAANVTSAEQGGARGLLRLGKSEPEPTVPPKQTVRQQPVRQTRSKRSGTR